MKLLTSQKNSIYDLIVKNGLSPSQFKFSKSANKYNYDGFATNLEYKNDEFYFSFQTAENSENDHYAIFSPGDDVYFEEFFSRSWNSQLAVFSNWLRYLKREITVPDKWKVLHDQVDHLDLKIDQDNDKFSAKEFIELTNRIIELKESLNKIDLLPEQLEIINSKLDHLNKTAEDLGKFDWKSLFIGTIVNTVIQLNLTPENAQLLWSTIKNVFSNYFLIE
ncbi:hypothetical protein [Salegentibacter maritimus]|uniref:Uncharacterized protein n=1 Tax=Salegentibacter maritimus TaxID=2794347 RepID=A0ABS0TL07_9FLAO|nr:hypothetical protein [Salegentibacter maritimus]MBI6120896.1 hypothetical protein [Salegentibacter maritimus]